MKQTNDFRAAAVPARSQEFQRPFDAQQRRYLCYTVPSPETLGER